MWLFGDNVDTDVIIPARYLNTSDPVELGAHCMEDIDPGCGRKIAPGDIIVAGNNFGCGSSREHAPIAIRASGIACVIAASFARIFYRNSFNRGLPIFECEEAVKAIKEGDVVEVDQDKGIIIDHTRDRKCSVLPLPPFMQELIESGGLLAYLKKKQLA